MASNPYSVYQNQQQTAEDMRISEARALLRCAAALEEVQAEGTPYFDYCNALRLNQRLWTLFQATLLEEGNQLPVHIKDALKSLSIYVDRRSIKAFSPQNPKALNVLININKEIAAGLMESAKNMPAAGAQPAASGIAPETISAMQQAGQQPGMRTNESV